MTLSRPSSGYFSGEGIDRNQPLDLGDLLAARPAWQSDAACKEHPGVNFYPERGESVEPARAVCAGCLVRDECAAFALDMGDQFGIWGGLSNRERNRIRRAKPKAQELPAHGTPGRYRKGCRCDPCRHAQQQAKAKYRKRAA